MAICGMDAGPRPLVLCVSGGSDSVALLLLVSQEKYGWHLHVLHFNHGLRPESASEESFVEGLALSADAKFHLRRADGARLKSAAGGMQAAARAWRRQEALQLLESLEGSAASGSGAVLLAHHADDQVETQLLKLLRGGHLARLSGMNLMEGRFARPLLGIRKQELQAFLKSVGQEWKEDASNQEPVYQRNRIRLQLVPLLTELIGGEDALHGRFEALAEQSEQLSSMLDDACKEVGGPSFPESFGEHEAGAAEAQEVQRVLDISSFGQLSEMVRQELLWRFVATGCGNMLSYPAVRAIAAGLASKNSSEPFTWPLGSGWQLRKLAAKPELVLSHKEESEEEAWIVEDLRVRRNFTPGLSLRVSRDGTLESHSEAAENSCRFLLDLPLNATVVLRGAKPGDRFCPGLSSRARAIKLTYFLHREMKVPREARYGWPVIAIQAPKLPEVVAAVLPSFAAGDFSATNFSRSPVLVEVAWTEPWPGLATEKSQPELSAVSRGPEPNSLRPTNP
ncbi:tilS [Symbiodinium sp. CCMP2592]|nr:tilS [Symbiodinium sp. CCMP2592]